ncbi:TolC family protein [Clostridium thermarum]|uniref:TolC family protein n=1 Tax=Clostridium thermarum TaxID=1716543 RepID=UPI0013D42972|nr:TolC family protein [Clostridium thermarum]
MIKRKKIIAVTIGLIMMFSVTTAYAAGRVYSNKNLDDLKQYVETDSINVQVIDLEKKAIESQYYEAYKQLVEYKKQTAIQQNQVDRLYFQMGQYQKKLKQQKLVEKYQLQVQYYNICLLMKQLNLAKSELELINKQIEVEEEKLNQGLSTQLAVDDLKSRKKLASDNITSITNAIELGKSEMKVKLNENKDVVFDPNFVIPTDVQGEDTYNLSTLTSKCKENNLQLAEINANIAFQSVLVNSIKSYVGDGDSSYIAVNTELSNLLLNKETVDKELSLYVEKQYNSFKNSLNNYNSMIQRKDILNRQLTVIDEQYNAGQISQLEKLTQRYSVLQELLDVDKAIVDKLNAITVMELVEEGIQLQ